MYHIVTIDINLPLIMPSKSPRISRCFRTNHRDYKGRSRDRSSGRDPERALIVIFVEL